MSSETQIKQTANIEICFGPQCSDDGGRALADKLKELGMISSMGDCRSQCPNAPMVLVNNKMICNATVDKVLAKIEEIEQV